MPTITGLRMRMAKRILGDIARIVGVFCIAVTLFSAIGVAMVYMADHVPPVWLLGPLFTVALIVFLVMAIQGINKYLRDIRSEAELDPRWNGND